MLSILCKVSWGQRGRLLALFLVSLSGCVHRPAFAQNAALMPLPKMQFFDSNGNPLVGGKVCTYAAGTSTPLATYTDQSAGSANTNPVILDASGYANIWISNNSYKIVLRTAGSDTTCATGSVLWTVDNVSNPGGFSPFPVSDAVTILKNAADPTKLVKFDLSNIATGTTRNLIVPDEDIFLAGLNISQTFFGTQTFDNIVVNGTCTGCSGSPANMMTTDTNQHVTGLKTFDIQINMGVGTNIRPVVSGSVNLGASPAHFGSGWIDNIAADTIQTNDLTITGTCTGCGGGGSLPVDDTTAIVKGSDDGSKRLRFEVDGFTIGATRVLTPQNQSYTLAGTNATGQVFSTYQNFALANSGGGVVGVQNTDPAGYSSVEFYSQAGTFRGSVGWANNFTTIAPATGAIALIAAQADTHIFLVTNDSGSGNTNKTVMDEFGNLIAVSSAGAGFQGSLGTAAAPWNSIYLQGGGEVQAGGSLAFKAGSSLQFESVAAVNFQTGSIVQVNGVNAAGGNFTTGGGCVMNFENGLLTSTSGC